jgi:N4-gp56 family major capsid protein
MAGQTWGAATAGGNLSIGMLSKKLRQTAQPLLRGDQFCRPEPGVGKHKGDTIYFNKVSDLSDSGAVATPLGETQPIPIDAVTINRGSIVLQEYGRGVAFTGKLEDLSEFQIDNVLMAPLRNHAAKVLNTLALDQFKATYVKYAPTGTAAAPTGSFDTDGTMSVAATRDIQAFDVYEIVEYMQGTLFVPFWDGENYAALAHPSFLRKLREDADWEWAAAYASPQNLLSGEIGRFHSVRFVKNTHGLTAALGTTSYKGSAVLFGEDAVAVARAVPMEIREKIPADFGRDKALAWYALLGYKIIWDQTAAAGQARIVQVTST